MHIAEALDAGEEGRRYRMFRLCENDQVYVGFCLHANRVIPGERSAL